MATLTHDFRNDRRTGGGDRRRAGAAPPEVDLRTEAAAARNRAELESARPAIVAAAVTDGVRVSWGGIWGGVLAAVGLLLLLAALGIAVGITATDPRQADAGTLGTAAGTWAAVSMLIALFVGGMVATRIGATLDRSTGFWEGALVWVVSLLLMAYLATSGVTSLAGGAISMIGGVAPVAAAAAPAGAEAQGVVDQVRTRIEGVTGGDLQQRAAEAKPAASRAAWVTFAALVLTLLASVLGAMAGRRRRLARY